VNDKAYIVPNLIESDCIYLNSPVVFWMLDRLTTKLRGGYLELKGGEVVGKVPMFPDLAQLDCELSSRELHTEICQIMGVRPKESEAILDWYTSRQVFRSEELVETAD